LQILAVLIFTFFIIDLGLSAIEISIALFLIGFIAYFIYGRRRSRKESALFHLMRRIADDRLINETIEDDFREIIIDRDNIEQDNFDRLLKKAKIIDLEGEYDFQTMLKIVVRDIAREVDMPEAEIRSRFEARQESDNTALSDFLAIPHIIIEGEDKMFMYVIRSRDGIRFTEDCESVKAIFLLGGTEDVKVLHLKTIAAIASLISEHSFEKSWMKAESTVDLKNLLLINERRRYH
ncbi:MAG: PTS transporter subunit EIIA, partial [Spirochaetales bacterium]|nr:PTS transporter subunit EIIA [Spirochaetales bacterium]